MMLAPILLFVYNRPAHAKRAIEALLHNTLAAESELFIYSDAKCPCPFCCGRAPMNDRRLQIGKRSAQFYPLRQWI